MNSSMSKYLAQFVSESVEHLEALGRDLVALEKEPAQAAAIDSMFRHAHSVKGMAASMGFEPIAQLAHRVEDVVDVLRTQPALCTREWVDLLLDASDVLLGQVKAAASGVPADPPAELLHQLAKLLPRSSRAEAAPSSSPSTSPATSSSGSAELGTHSRWEVKARITASCPVPGVRGFLVYKKLSALSTRVEIKPGLDDIKAGRIPEGHIVLDLQTSVGEAGIQKALRNVPDVELISIVSFAPKDPPPVPAASAESPKANPEADATRTIRIRADVLDHLLDTAGELLLASARIREVGKLLPEGVRPQLEEPVYRLHTLIKDLHDKVMKARMTPVGVVLDRLPRAARDIARRRNREVNLVLNGADVELDRAIVGELADPLLHLLRNCIDHGLESPEERASVGKPVSGTVRINVSRSKDRVVFEMEDDGRGMDPERLRASAVARGLLGTEEAARMTDREAFLLSCLPGVSTAKDVSDISGRGVGMDAVKRMVEGVGGTLEIDSEKGRGTRFTLRLPLTVAVVHLLLVQVGHEVMGLPLGKVVGAVEAEPSLLSQSRGAFVLPWGGGLLPVHTLADLLQLPGDGVNRSRPYVVVEGDAGRVALAVDRLLGQEEVVLKSLSRPLDMVPGLSGVTILGSGRPIFILDVPRLIA